MNRLIIVSNRLPVKINKSKGDYEVVPSAGGLATGLKSYHQEGNSVWIGWPGISMQTAKEKDDVKKLLKELKCAPIFLNPNLISKYYDGFSNTTLWPLFHYFTEYTKFEKDHWEAYKKVNQLFAEEIISIAEQNDTVWVHDFQLMLLPGLLKSKRPDLNIGFFLHIPFPSYEVFRILPWREHIVKGVLGADLIGFHTYDYARHFISSVKRLLGYDVNFNIVSTETRKIFIDVFPMGIDYEKFQNKAIEVQNKSLNERSKVHQDMENFLKEVPDRKIILSIDRLDYTKGIPQRLNAFRELLIKYPQFKEKVSLVMITVPSRTSVEQYQNLRSEVDELVGRINGEFGTMSWNPVIYFFRSILFENLIELLYTADIALLTPLRDGMNLVAKEYIASKVKPTGVLILSEMAGATKELGEAILVNPNNVEDVTNAIYEALKMNSKEQESNMLSMQARIKRYNVYRWASEFIKSLSNIKSRQEESQAKKVTDAVSCDIYQKFKSAKKKLLFLDYDGTLQRFYGNPQDAKPDDALMQIIQSLVLLDDTELVIISGRDKDTLENWFGQTAITIIAEHGAWIRPMNRVWKSRNLRHSEWKNSIRPILESYVDRTPGSLLEEKSHSLAWHYRKVDVDLGALRALELTADVSNLILNQDLEIFEGKKVIEVKVSGINKGHAALEYIGKEHYDFILAIGDDWTDEYLFKELPNHSITIKVNTATSAASFYVDGYKDVRGFLKGLLVN